jgi:VanZ family protein
VRRRGVSWILVVGYATLIWAMSSVPSVELPVDVPVNTDKLIHIVEYGILAYLVCRAVDKPAPAALALVAIACIAYGILDEVHQSFTGRFASAWDALADGIGVVISVAVWRKRRLRTTAGISSEE